jgi:hypothetical protein
MRFLTRSIAIHAQLPNRTMPDAALRRRQLVIALRTAGLGLRSDSSLCDQYIAFGAGNVPSIVAIMGKMNLVYASGPMALRFEFSNARENYFQSHSRAPPRRRYRNYDRYDRYDRYGEYDDYGDYDDYDDYGDTREYNREVGITASNIGSSRAVWSALMGKHGDDILSTNLYLSEARWRLNRVIDLAVADPRAAGKTRDKIREMVMASRNSQLDQYVCNATGIPSPDLILGITPAYRDRFQEISLKRKVHPLDK